LAIRRKHVWLMIGTGVVVILAAISIPKYNTVMLASKETVLKSNLLEMRLAIDQYTKDKRQPPRSLEDLVNAGYFRELPTDPITRSNSTWLPVIQSVAVSPGQSVQGVADLRSGSTSTSSDGTVYAAW
jgi:general secretion pathway protein G